MKRLCFCILTAAVFMAAPCWATLDDPAISDPSFENDTWDGSWFNRTRYFSIDSDTQETIPDTPYGEYWVKFGNSSWIFQQIGTWEPDMYLDISMISGKEAGMNYGGLKISLFAGGDPSVAADAGDNDVPPDNLVNVVGATLVAESQQFDYPNGDDMGTFDVAVTLNTGTEGTVGDPLWLLVQSASSQKTLVDNVSVKLPEAAIQPYPASGEQRAPIDADLDWSAPPVGTVQKYVLTYRNDPNFTEPGNTVVDPVTPPYDMGTMPYDTPYYWRVDVVNNLGETIQGYVWDFETVPEIPVFDQQPQGQLVADDGTEDATFTVGGLNITNYQWLKDGAAITAANASGVNTDTLTVSGAALADEGTYTCLVDNGQGDSLESEPALLMTKRLVAEYDFENNLADSQGNLGDGVIVDPNTADPNVPDISYTTGVVGSSALLFNSSEDPGYDPGVVEMPASAGKLNFYDLGVTVSAWVKFNSPETSYMGTIVTCRDEELGYNWFLNRYYGNARWRTTGLATSTSDLEVDLRDGQWHLFTGVYDPDAQQTAVYVDGLLAATTDGAATPANLESQAILRVGGRYITEELGIDRALEDTAVDDLKVYSYRLDPVDIAVEYTDVMGGSLCIDDEGLEYDFNDDCEIDLADVAIFVDQWLNCRIVPDCIN
ncbi:Immunoglobulin I-set domain protein [Anaerohalosphaera lusitana]|uniref:Immunoglobulin I-set domain protein n=1 Tax=Anaerohalosphaera lusitana TaxID=1936003 RepID=A0A1U9NLL3_9BACT|nr:LamG-like jellyroll fold domain-containing protein [Anaerohalosphaera lusitana]AQT68823.1 Immunoglobulin I-set domain protein [Anaerohalosphaera lusitana]